MPSSILTAFPSARPPPSITYSTSSAASLRSDARPSSSSTRSAIFPAKWLHTVSAPSRTGVPSFNPATRHPPLSSKAISWDYVRSMQPKEDGIHATNQDFIRYDQVEKRQTYHLAEGDDAGQFDEEFVIRTCDVGRFFRVDTRGFAADLGDALREIGFAILEGHGVDPALYAEAETKVEELFTRLTLEEKMRFRAQRHGSVNQGYFPIKETSNMHPDLVEGWDFCRRAFERQQEF